MSPGPRGRADGLGDIPVGKANALAREPVEIRGRKALGSVDPNVSVPLIVGKDDDDVRQFFRGNGRTYGRCEHTSGEGELDDSAKRAGGSHVESITDD